MNKPRALVYLQKKGQKKKEKHLKKKAFDVENFKSRQ